MTDVNDRFLRLSFPYWRLEREDVRESSQLRGPTGERKGEPAQTLSTKWSFYLFLFFFFLFLLFSLPFFFVFPFHFLYLTASEEKLARGKKRRTPTSILEHSTKLCQKTCHFFSHR